MAQSIGLCVTTQQLKPAHAILMPLCNLRLPAHFTGSEVPACRRHSDVDVIALVDENSKRANPLVLARTLKPLVPAAQAKLPAPFPKHENFCLFVSLLLFRDLLVSHLTLRPTSYAHHFLT